MSAVIPGTANDSLTTAADAARRGDAAFLAAALSAGREQLLALFDGFERALGATGLQVAYDPVLNLPLWELGHISWFEEFWLARNAQQQRQLGAACDPHVARSASLLAGADALYDSSQVPHAQRWQLHLPDPPATRRYGAAVREQTLVLLRDAGPGDDALYFFRLVLFHQDMHIEAWHFMAQQLAVDLGPAMTGRSPRATTAQGEWRAPAATLEMGSSGAGFAFDNERGAHAVPVAGLSIDRAPVSWARFLPFIEAGGYDDARWWSAAGWQWRLRQPAGLPRHLRRAGPGGSWQQQRFGAWLPLDLGAPALHLSAFEAQAWCCWARRRLPTEAEWEGAATRAAALGEAFEWGGVWEWTATPFAPYPGFVPHPYRDYSQPWFDNRPVLRGGSFATAPQMKHPCYRNFFSPDRNDVFAGFRSCAPD